MTINRLNKWTILFKNYKIILEELINTCNHIKTTNQIRLPKLSDIELIALNITAEYMSINSELQLFRYISGTELQGKIDRSVYNKRKRRLFPYIEKIRGTLSNKFSDFTNVFIVDSTPIEICKISRANRSAICSRRYQTFFWIACCTENQVFWLQTSCSLWQKRNLPFVWIYPCQCTWCKLSEACERKFKELFVDRRQWIY